MPVHGEWRHLRAKAALAVATGVPEDAGGAAPNGTVVDLVDGKAAITGHVEVGMVYVDGNAVGDVGEYTLSDRLVLGEGGFISITVAIDSHTGRAVSRPDDLRARLLRRPQGAGRGGAAGRGRALAHRGGRDHRHRTGSPRRCAGWSAGGSARPTGAGR